MIEGSQTVGDIAANVPASTRVFERHNIDFCCGGKLSLAEACEQYDSPLERVISEIEDEVAKAEPTELDGWAERSNEELIEHILANYHRPLDDELPRLEQLALKVAHVHGRRDENLAEIARITVELKGELERHFVKEEEVLFPAILSDEADQLACPIEVMLRDHEGAGEQLERLRELTGDYVVPEMACASWRALWHGLEDLERSLHEHIHLENNILFERVES